MNKLPYSGKSQILSHRIISWHCVIICMNFWNSKCRGHVSDETSDSFYHFKNAWMISLSGSPYITILNDLIWNFHYLNQYYLIITVTIKVYFVMHVSNYSLSYFETIIWMTANWITSLVKTIVNTYCMGFILLSFTFSAAYISLLYCITKNSSFHLSQLHYYPNSDFIFNQCYRDLGQGR